MLPSLRYAFLMSSTEASYAGRQLLLPAVKCCKQTYIGQFQVRIVVSFDVGLHHDPGKTVASQRRGVVRCDTIKALRREVGAAEMSMRRVVRGQTVGSKVIRVQGEANK